MDLYLFVKDDSSGFVFIELMLFIEWICYISISGVSRRKHTCTHVIINSDSLLNYLLCCIVISIGGKPTYLKKTLN